MNLLYKVIIYLALSLMSSSPHLEMSAKQLRDNVETAFNKLDTNQDGVLTREEFVNSCLKVPALYL